MKKYMLVFVDDKDVQRVISSDNYDLIKTDYNIVKYARGYSAELYEYDFLPQFDDMTMGYNLIM